MLGCLSDFIILAFRKMTEASVLVFWKIFIATEVNVQIWKASFSTEKIPLPRVVSILQIVEKFFSIEWQAFRSCSVIRPCMTWLEPNWQCEIKNNIKKTLKLGPKECLQLQIITSNRQEKVRNMADSLVRNIECLGREDESTF